MKKRKTACLASMLAIFASIIVLVPEISGSPAGVTPRTKPGNNVKRVSGRRRSHTGRIVRKRVPKLSEPSQVIDLAVRSLKTAACKSLFHLRTTTPDALLVSPEVKVSFVDLSRVEIAPGNWGKVVGISGGTSGTVVVEQPDGKTFYSERILAERSGLKIIRVVQGGGGKIRIHKDLKPTAEAAFVLNHELGHVADKLFGDDASMIIDDAANSADVSKELHRRNDNTMAACKSEIFRL